jgi:hypothetical protein
LKFDINELREQYAELSDEALLAVNPEELVPMAQECYRTELAKRGLEPEALAEPEGPMNHLNGETGKPAGQVVPAGDYGSPDEANLAKAMLKAAGIPCALSTEYSGSVNLGPYGSNNAIYALVPESLLEEAQEVLASEISEEELAAQAEAAAPEEEEEPAEEPEEER